MKPSRKTKARLSKPGEPAPRAADHEGVKMPDGFDTATIHGNNLRQNSRHVTMFPHMTVLVVITAKRRSTGQTRKKVSAGHTLKEQGTALVRREHTPPPGHRPAMRHRPAMLLLVYVPRRQQLRVRYRPPIARHLPSPASLKAPLFFFLKPHFPRNATMGTSSALIGTWAFTVRTRKAPPDGSTF